MNKSFVLGIKLLLITAVAALCLSLTNSFTEPIIEEKRQEELAEAFKEVYADAEEFKEIDKSVADNLPENIISCYQVMKGGNADGYVFEISAPGGYGGDIVFTLGVNNDMEIQGFKSISHQESAGFGSKMDEQPFMDGVKGASMSEEVSATEDGAGDNEIAAISGATYSTNAILGGINTIREAMESLK